MIITESMLQEMILDTVQNQITINEINEVHKACMPFFKEVVLEERRQLRTWMLLEGYVEEYEILLEADRAYEQRLNEGKFDLMYDSRLDEGIWDSIKSVGSKIVGGVKSAASAVGDIGIGVGQMLGGGIGQIAGIAGLAKYGPEFLSAMGGKFIDWFGSFISVFFSAQALFFPMPAVGSLKAVFVGFAKGVKNILSGAGGLLARGVKAVLSKGAGFIQKAIGLFVKAIKGIGNAIKAGGPTVQKAADKMGGGGMIKKLLAGMKTAMDEVVKRLTVLKDLLVKGVDPKEIIKRAFGASKDKLDDAAKMATGVADDAAKMAKAAIPAAQKSSQIVKNYAKDFYVATQAGRKQLGQFLKDFMKKNAKHIDEITKPLKGKEYPGLGVFKGVTETGTIKIASNRLGGNIERFNIGTLMGNKYFHSLGRDLKTLKDPLADMLSSAGSYMIASNTAQGARGLSAIASKSRTDKAERAAVDAARKERIKATRQASAPKLRRAAEPTTGGRQRISEGKSYDATRWQKLAGIN